MIFELLLPGASGPISVPEPSGFKFTGAAGTVGAIFSEALKYVFPIAGLVLFFMLIAGGFQLLTAAGNADAVKAGYNKILYAFVGFLIIFVAYWAIQILEMILGIKVF